MSIFVTSDLHFGHKNIIKYENRPHNTIEEMDKDLISKWNSVVKENDTVYILGDFSWYKGEQTNEILKQLNGRKTLIVGNHDEIFLKDKKFDKSLFEEIIMYKQVKHNKKVFVLFHYPIAEYNGKMNGYIHLYGHIHSMNLELEKELGELCHNVGVDRNNYTPVNIERYIGGTDE
ncbi:MAG: hydrolase [Clostridia bacterium]|jgi:calcineurin-like phosphoesterase family protein|nr:hydrolase [Clostridia bacterium]